MEPENVILIKSLDHEKIIIPSTTINNIIATGQRYGREIIKIEVRRKNWFWDMSLLVFFIWDEYFCPNCGQAMVQVNVNYRILPIIGCKDMNRTRWCDYFANYCDKCQFLHCFTGHLDL